MLFTLVFLGTFIDLQNTPQDISEYMMKIGARVPGVDGAPPPAAVASAAALRRRG